MSENAIDSENISKPAPDAAKPKGARKPARKPSPRRRRAAPRSSRQAEGGPHQQEGGSDRDDEAREGSDTRRDHALRFTLHLARMMRGILVDQAFSR